MLCNFSDDEAETLQLVVDHAIQAAQATYDQVTQDRIYEDMTDYLTVMADAERTMRDLQRIKEEVNK